jgi:hypothetical protein
VAQREIADGCGSKVSANPSFTAHSLVTRHPNQRMFHFGEFPTREVVDTRLGKDFSSFRMRQKAFP